MERRDALIWIAGILGLTVTQIPNKWTRPLVEKVMVPAHAQTSPPPTTTTPPDVPTTTPPPGNPTTTTPPTTEPPTTPPTFVIEVVAYKRRIGGQDLVMRDQGQCGDTLIVTAPNDSEFEAVVIAFVDGLPEPEVAYQGYGSYVSHPFPGCMVNLVFKSPHD